MSLLLHLIVILVALILILLLPSPSQALGSNDIQQQINSLPTTGGVVTLKAGEYLLSTSNGTLYTFPNGNPIHTAIIINKSNVTLEGNPQGTTLKLAPHVKMRIISVSSKNVTIKNLKLDGNKTNRDGSTPWPNGDVVDGLLFGGETADNLTFENLEIMNGIEDAMGCWKCHNLVGRNNYNHDNGTLKAGAAGFSISGAIGGLAINNRIENNTATGIWSSFDANNIKILNNVIRNNAAGGITIGGGDQMSGIGQNNSGFEIRNNTLSSNGLNKFATITIYASNNGTLDNNKIESSPYDSIQIGGNTSYKSTNWVITNNSCGPNTSIRNMGNTENITITNNNCVTKPGDYNHDNMVDLVDFSFWKTEYLQNRMTLVDFSIWKSAYMQPN